MPRHSPLQQGLTIGPALLEALPDDLPLLQVAGRNHTVAEIAALTRSCLAGLSAAGIRGGQRVGLHLGAGPKRLALFLAVAALGAVVVPLDPALGQARLMIACQAAELDLVLTDDIPLPATVRNGLKVLRFEDLDHGAASRPLPRPRPDRAAVVLFGQGARDSGRAVVLSHGALLAAAGGLNRHYALGPGQRVHVPLTYNHAPRLTAELAAVLGGFCLSDDSAVDLAIVTDEAAHFPPERAPRAILASGEARAMRALMRRYPQTTLYNCYARAEMCGIALASDPRDPAHTALTTVGRPLGGVEVMIVDPRTGFDMLLYEVGEVWLRGHTTMTGYDHAPKATAAARDSAGFLHTGEMGYLDSEGRVILATTYAQI